MRNIRLIYVGNLTVVKLCAMYHRMTSTLSTCGLRAYGGPDYLVATAPLSRPFSYTFDCVVDVMLCYVQHLS